MLQEKLIIQDDGSNILHLNRLGLTQNLEPARENKTFPTTGTVNGPSSWNDHTYLRISMQCGIS